MKRIQIQRSLVVLPALFLVVTLQALYASSVKLNPPLTNALVRYAQFTPDSQKIIYRINYQDDNSYAIYRVPISGGESVQLSHRGFDGWFTNYVPSVSSNSEYLVYRSNHENAEVLELFSVPIHGVFSDTVKLNDQLVVGGDVAAASFNDAQISPTNDRVAYIADQEMDEKYELYSVPIGGPANAGVKLSAPLLDTEDVTIFKFTPDGQFIVYMAKCTNCGSSDTAIYSVPSDGPAMAALNLTAALDTGGRVINFKIGPDSENLVYESLSQSGFSHIYKVPIIGGTTPVTVTTRYVDNYDISRDGHFIVYSASPTSTAYAPELYRVPFATSPNGEIKLNHELVEGGMVLQFVITPDSSRVVYHASDTAQTTFGLFAASINATDPVVKLNDFPIYRWSYPYQVTDNSHYVVYPEDDRSAFYRVPIVGPSSATLRLTAELPDGSYVGPSTVTSDSRAFVYVADAETAGVYEFFRVPFNGPVNETVKINGPMVAGGVVWNIAVSPNGRYALYLADEEVVGKWELYISEINPPLDQHVFLPVVTAH